jgi:hypothetical protein
MEEIQRPESSMNQFLDSQQLTDFQKAHIQGYCMGFEQGVDRAMAEIRKKVGIDYNVAKKAFELLEIYFAEQTGY